MPMPPSWQPIWTWTNSQKADAIMFVRVLQERNRGIEGVLFAAHHAIARGGGPRPTPAQGKAIAELTQGLGACEQLEAEVVTTLKQAAREAIAQGKVSADDLRGSGLAALPLLILVVAIAAALVIFVALIGYGLMQRWNTTQVALQPRMVVAKVYADAYAEWAANRADQSMPPPPPVPMADPTFAAGGEPLGLIAVAALAAGGLYLFSSRRRAA